MQRRRIHIIFVVIMLVLSACQQNKDIKVGLLLDKFDSERWEKDKKYFVERIHELGGSVVVKVCGEDVSRQLKQADTLINGEEVDVLVVVPSDLEEAAKIVENAHKKDIKVIAYDRLINDCDLDLYLATDNVGVGVLMAQKMAEMCPEGNYALINGPTRDNNSFLMRLGQMSILLPLQEKDKINIIYNKFAKEWSVQAGYNEMMTCYEESEDTADAVIAGNDAIARGVINAIAQHDSAFDILVAGQDAELRAIQSIIAGKQAFTIYKPIKESARLAAELAIQIADNKDIKDQRMTTINNGHKMVPAFLVSSSVVVTKDNIDETVIADDFLDKSNVYEE